MGLRRRVALAEQATVKSQELKDAMNAKRAAESALVDARTEAEQMRARLVSVDTVRERAEVAERSERSLRQRVKALENKIDGRNGLIQQMLTERQKLTKLMAMYERELAKKEARMAEYDRAGRDKHTRRRYIHVGDNVSNVERSVKHIGYENENDHFHDAGDVENDESIINEESENSFKLRSLVLTRTGAFVSRTSNRTFNRFLSLMMGNCHAQDKVL